MNTAFHTLIFALTIIAIPVFCYAEKDPEYSIKTAISAQGLTIYLSGLIRSPMAADLRKIIDHHGHHLPITLKLNSDGGSIYETEEIINLLRTLSDLTTEVSNGNECSSNCVPIFAQGKSRKAGPVAAFMFHGIAVYAISNIPDPELTNKMIAFYQRADIDMNFFERLKKDKVYSTPGMYWLSGKELFDTKANIVTQLLERHQVATPYDYSYSNKPN